MSEHVVGRVTGTRVCLSCSDLSASGAWECCPPNDQCPCCLSAELTALRAELRRVTDEWTKARRLVDLYMDGGESDE